MSVTKRIAFGAAAAWFSRAVTVLLGLVLMPVLLHALPKEEVGIWLLLGQSWAVMGILDLGFGVVLTRRIALAKGKSGGDPDAPLTPESKAEIADLVASGLRVYRIMAAGVFVTAFTLGFFYLRNLDLHAVSYGAVWVAWGILCVCQALLVWGTVWGCLLQGVGYVGWQSLLGCLVGAGTLGLQIAAVLTGGGVVALAVIAAVGALAQRAFVLGVCRKKQPELFAVKGAWNPGVLAGTPGMALRTWFTSMGTVLVFNTDGFFIAAAEGAADIPAYRAAFLVFLNMHMLAAALAQSSSVFISQLWQAGQYAEVNRIFQRNLRAGLCLMLCGSAAVLAAGENLFNVWLGAGNYAGFEIVAVFVLLFVLEQQSFIIMTSARATDHEPFSLWAMAGGLLKLLLALPLMRRFGLPGLAVATLAAQMMTAHWYIACRGLGRLNYGFGRYVSMVILPCLAVFGLALGAGYAGTLVSAGQPDWVRLLTVTAGAGVVLVGALWLLVADANQRGRLLSMIGNWRKVALGGQPL